MTTEVNSDGLVVRYNGDGVTERKKAAVTSTSGHERELVLDFDYASATDTIEGPTAANDSSYGYIPAGAVIRDASFTVLEAFSDTASFTGLEVGLDELDGTEIDMDGFLASGSGGAKANLTSTGAVACATTLIGDVMTDNAYPYVATTGSADPTAGRARLVVRYTI